MPCKALPSTTVDESTRRPVKVPAVVTVNVPTVTVPMLALVKVALEYVIVDPVTPAKLAVDVTVKNCVRVLIEFICLTVALEMFEAPLWNVGVMLVMVEIWTVPKIGAAFALTPRVNKAIAARSSFFIRSPVGSK